MTIRYLDYELENGYIHNWIVAGPEAILVADLDRYTGADYKLQIAHHYYDAASGVVQTPAETETLKLGDYETPWEYVRCRDDHLIDLSAFYHRCHYLRAWAYSQVVSPFAQTVTFTLTTNGPADLWLNGEHVHRQEHFHHQIPHRVTFSAGLAAGPNEILVRFEEVAARECPYGMALRLAGAEGVSVRVPTATENVERRQSLERALYAAHLRRDMFVYDDEVQIYWPNDFPECTPLTIRLQSPDGRIYSEGDKQAKAGGVAIMGTAYQFPDGAFDLLLMPTLREYYEGNQRVTRKLRCWVTRNRYSIAPYGDDMQRRHEAAVDALRRDENIFSEIARMVMNDWQRIDWTIVQKTIDGINARGDCSDFYLVGLLGMLYRFGQDPAFPPEFKLSLEQCILNFKYWSDEPGSDSMWYWSENHSILFHTCQVLAGQLYPDRVFTNNGETGEQHRAKGEARALAWLRDRGTLGFKEWDSNCYFEQDVLALSHLASLAENVDLKEMASVVLDKLFFTLAVNSYRGVFGSTHGRTYTRLIKSGHNEATAGLSRILWGMGTFNTHVLGTVALACSDYALPPLIAQIAADQPEEMWSRERHTGSAEDFRTSGESWPDVDKVTYKTPDYMLCSAQDYYPGRSGCQQHIWQATFSPDAVVFVTHPTCASEDDSHRPNFWHGNATLPRVAQWKDVLIAVHNFSPDDWMGFTHAFFPAFAFDVFELENGWALGRKDEGYIALTAARGLEWMTRGENAYRELRSFGHQNVWLCHMGRRAVDGPYQEFKQKILALPKVFGDLAVTLRSLRGDQIAFGWEGPLMVNGQPQPLTGFKHYDNPYCVADLPATEMEIHLGEDGLRLKFAEKQE